MSLVSILTEVTKQLFYLQLYQPRRIQVIPKLVLRKKRSFKRQASQIGRGKHRPILPGTYQLIFYIYIYILYANNVRS